MTAALGRWLAVSAGWFADPTDEVTLGVLALAALLGWFGVAGRDRPARVRAGMLAGLLLATLGEAAGLLLSGPYEPPPPTASVPDLLGLLAGAWLPTLLGTAALACYLVAFLGLPPRTRPGPPGRVRSRWRPASPGGPTWPWG
jgi:hypothetical protein